MKKPILTVFALCLLVTPVFAADAKPAKGAPKVVTDLWGGDAALADAQKLIQGGEYAKAIAILEDIVGRNMRNSDAHMMLATCWYNLGDMDKEQKELTTVIAIDRGNMGAYVLSGYVALRDDNVRQAEYYLNALKVVCGSDSCAEYHALKNAID